MSEFYSPIIYLDELLTAQKQWEKMAQFERFDFLCQIFSWRHPKLIGWLSKLSLRGIEKWEKT